MPSSRVRAVALRRRYIDIPKAILDAQRSNHDAVNLQTKAARRQTQYVTFLSLTGLA